MLKRVTAGVYSHDDGDNYTINLTTNAGTQLVAAAICGNDIALPNVTSAKYAPCPKNYVVGIVVRFLDADGKAKITLKDSTGQQVDSFDVNPPAPIPGDTSVSLAFRRP